MSSEGRQKVESTAQKGARELASSKLVLLEAIMQAKATSKTEVVGKTRATKSRSRPKAAKSRKRA